MGLFNNLFGTKADSLKSNPPESSIFTEGELSDLAKEIDESHERIMSSHETNDLMLIPCFPKGALLNSAAIVDLCRKSKKDAHEYIMSFYDQGGQYLFHRKQCQFVLSIWTYKRFGAKISEKVDSFIIDAVGKEPDDCEYLIKEEHLW